MIPGVIYCFLALLWAGAGFILGYCRQDCRDILSRPVSFLLGLATFCALVECVLLMGIGVAMIAGYH
nr:MAG TPA: hypothetical protein [Caudoviricetes sp.]